MEDSNIKHCCKGFKTIFKTRLVVNTTDFYNG